MVRRAMVVVLSVIFVPPARSGTSGCDVLVHPEEVVRVVATFDLGEAVVVLAVVGTDPALIVAGHEVDVAALLGVGRNRLGVPAAPFDVRRGVGGVGPTRAEAYGEVGVPVGEGGLLRRDAVARSVDGEQQGRGLGARDRGPILEVDFNGRVGQASDEVTLPVV